MPEYTMEETQRYRERRRALAAVARETKSLTPTVMASLPHLDLTRAELLSLDDLAPLDLAACPRFTVPGSSVCGPRVRVVNEDTLDVAIALASGTTDASSKAAASRVAVLNMASPTSPGGGWLGGASAQEEAICMRSTLAASLHRSHYPLPTRGGLYTANVAVFRTSAAAGHVLTLPPSTPAGDLPIVSVLSVAGVRRPEVKQDDTGSLVFANPAARELTKDKMRLCLRVAAARGHGLLVLGALGCGAFRGPPRDVAECWREVLGEGEFAGGWFCEVWFAVFDRRGEGNYEIFRDVLEGKVWKEVGK